MAGEAAPGHSGEKPRLPGAGAEPSDAGEKQWREQEEGRWKPVLDLPCELSIELPLPGFLIADLLKLRGGSVVDTRWGVGEDVPLRINGTLIGWSEFEVVQDRLAVRLTELV